MSRLSPDNQLALDALRQAVAEALERKRRLGQYAVTWCEGSPVLAIPDPPAQAQIKPRRETGS